MTREPPLRAETGCPGWRRATAGESLALRCPLLQCPARPRPCLRPEMTILRGPPLNAPYRAMAFPVRRSGGIDELPSGDQGAGVPGAAPPARAAAGRGRAHI